MEVRDCYELGSSISLQTLRPKFHLDLSVPEHHSRAVDGGAAQPD